MKLPWGLGVAIAAAACGDNLAAPVDAAPDAGPFMEAAHGTPPQLVNDGGSALAAPVFQPIFFTGDSVMQAQIEDFGAQLGSSAYWSAATSEYGVGPIQLLPTIVSSDAVPTTETDVESWLTSELGSAVDPQTIYSVFLPANMQITGADGTSCQSYGGYHYEIDNGSGSDAETPIVYALLPRCGGTGSDAIDILTAALSHELVEASTDPHPITALAWGDADPLHYVMAYTPGAEAGDYCEYVEAAYYIPFGYEVQRIWSNAASLAGHDPCVPAPLSLPYAGAVPVFPGTVQIPDYNNNPVTTEGISIAVGSAATIDVQLFSDVPTAAFTVSAFDANTVYGQAADLSLAFDKTTGSNGDVVHLTITRMKAGQLPGSEFAIEAIVNSVTVSQSWGYVTN